MNEPKVTAVVQIGIVVRSTDEAMRHYANLLGINDWNINYVNTDEGKGRNFRVGGEDASVKAKIAWTNVGDIELELIEPQDENSIYAKYLRSNGPGVHHLMFGTSNYQNTVDNMRQKSVKNIASGELQATRFQMFDTVEMLGTISEFAEGDALIPDTKLD